MSLDDMRHFHHAHVAGFNASHLYEMEIKLLLKLFLTYPLIPFDKNASFEILTGLKNALHAAKNSHPAEYTRCVIRELLRRASIILLDHRHNNLEASICRMLIRAMKTLNTRTDEAALLRVIEILSDTPQFVTTDCMINALHAALRACRA
jgi:hypothetical protein